MGYIGINAFFQKPGKVKEMRCKACNSVCKVTRNRYGPTSTASAMLKKSFYHDYFDCPNSGKDWHEKAVELWRAMNDTPSESIASLIKGDLEKTLGRADLD